MSARKLQQEFDKVNKKIAEGLQSFDDTYEKLTTTELQSQKEKLELDLKKEIKKLQRLRDQLKIWLNDSGIKLDKSEIKRNRTLIEHAMDLFKELEKLLKIKQFSNEGLELQLQGVLLEEDRKKKQACEYISTQIEELNHQNETLELELHHIRGKKKSLNNAEAEDVREKIDRNNNHLTRLETVLRLLENEELHPEKIELIRDDLDYYVESNMEDDFVDYDDFYDQLEIDDTHHDVHGTLSQVDHYQQLLQAPSAQPPVTEVKKDVKKKAMSPPKIAKVSSKDNTAPALSLGTDIASPVASGATMATTVTTAASADEAAPATTNNLATTTASEASPVGNAQPERASKQPTTTTGVSSKGTDLPAASSNQTPPGLDPISSNTPPIVELSAPQARLQHPLPFAQISHLLESLLLHCPDSIDAEKPKQYNPVNIHPLSIDYPQEPMLELNLARLMQKFEVDTLQFCFYYLEGPDVLARYHAAKELSKRGWVFNTETKQWFLKDTHATKRGTTPKLAGDSNNQEEDNYKYFDYENNWLIRRRENFSFPKEIQETF